MRKGPRSGQAKFIPSVRPPEPVLPEAEAVRAGSVPSAGSVASAQRPLRDGLSACHCACCHRLPGGPRAAGPPVGALRSPHSQATGGDSPQGGAAAVAGGWQCWAEWVPAQSDSPGEASRLRPAGLRCGTLGSLAGFSQSTVEVTGAVTWWSPFLAALSGVGPVF